MKGSLLGILISLLTYSATALTFNALEQLELTLFPHPQTTRPWRTRQGIEFKQTDLAEKVFGGFENVLHPIIEKLLSQHPDVSKLHEEGKIQVNHYMVPMRDGARLSTFVINPYPFEKKKSAMISRSPYGPTSDQFADIFIVLNGFAAVIQDQRGSFLSEGEFSLWKHDSDDGFDTAAWIEKQSWSNGNVFSIGVSADGCGTGAMILSQPSQLKGQIIMWASLDGHETAFPGGIFREGLVTGWMTLMAPLTRGTSLKKTLPDIIAHEALSDWWTPIQGPGHYHQANWPTIHISAWWDIFQGHHISMFNGVSQYSTSHPHYLFVGPLGHCLLGNLDPFLLKKETVGIINALGFASELFDESSSKSTTFRDKIKKINVYVQGSRKEGRRGEGKVGHYWSSMNSWPEPSIHRLLLSPNKELMFEAPMLESESASGKNNLRKAHEKDDFVEFTYDPAIPMITRGGNNLILIFLGMGCGSEDQRVVESRNDVAVFTTSEPLQEPLALMGNMKAILYVSTNREDTDFYVSVTDVHPDGASMQIRYGARRMRWRESTPFRSVLSETDGDIVYKLEIDLWFTSYIVAPGHHLRVMIGSANTPYYAKNDNSGKDPLGMKYELPAVNRVYWSKAYPSHIELPVVDIADLPLNEDF